MFLLFFLVYGPTTSSEPSILGGSEVSAHIEVALPSPSAVVGDADDADAFNVAGWKACRAKSLNTTSGSNVFLISVSVNSFSASETKRAFSFNAVPIDRSSYPLKLLPSTTTFCKFELFQFAHSRLLYLFLERRNKPHVNFIKIIIFFLCNSTA